MGAGQSGSPSSGPTIPDRMTGVILGTAGHIDHGKSALVKALTGADPDRLKEEKERGITIDLGFANLSFPEKNLVVGIVDVPGHERLIKNMLAGAGGIDILLMVVAADEGIMPQSREHLAICNLLKIKNGIVVITKTDLVDSDWLQLVTEDVKGFVKGTFLEGADIIAVSSKTGHNLDLLKQKICDLAAAVTPKPVKGIFRLPVDRVFTQKGFGTVVTGTAISGAINVEDAVEILPSGIKSRVRGLQTHGRSVAQAYAGQRIGLNLQGVERELLKRGDVVVMPDRFTPTNAVDARLEMLDGAPTVKSRSRVHFYCGTSESLARIIIYGADEVRAGESCFCQFRLEDPVVSLSGDRYIIRRFSPLETMGGGAILDPHPVKRKRKMGLEDLELFERGSLPDRIEALVRRAGFRGYGILQIEGWFSSELPEIEAAIDRLAGRGILTRNRGRLFHRDVIADLGRKLKDILKKYHSANPLKTGMPKEELRACIMSEAGEGDAIFDLVAGMADIVFEKDAVRLKAFTVSLSVSGEGVRDRIIAALEKAGFQPPVKAELALELRISEKETDDMLKLLAGEGALVRINDSMYITRSRHEKMIGLLRGFFAAKSEMGVAEFRDLLATSRKYSIPFLEYLDSHRITLRVGDIRKFMLK
jgi:selenocysteine-specific elongation factor